MLSSISKSLSTFFPISVEKKLEAELVNVTGTAKPTRKIRWMSDFDGFEFSHPEYSIQGLGLLYTHCSMHVAATYVHPYSFYFFLFFVIILNLIPFIVLSILNLSFL